MSHDRPAPATGGEYSFTCRHCGAKRWTDRRLQRFCNTTCKSRYHNRRHYWANRKAMIRRVQEYRRRKKEEEG